MRLFFRTRLDSHAQHMHTRKSSLLAVYNERRPSWVSPAMVVEHDETTLPPPATIDSDEIHPAPSDEI